MNKIQGKKMPSILRLIVYREETKKLPSRILHIFMASCALQLPPLRRKFPPVAEITVLESKVLTNFKDEFNHSSQVPIKDFFLATQNVSTFLSNSVMRCLKFVVNLVLPTSRSAQSTPEIVLIIILFYRSLLISSEKISHFENFLNCLKPL